MDPRAKLFAEAQAEAKKEADAWLKDQEAQREAKKEADARLKDQEKIQEMEDRATTLDEWQVSRSSGPEEVR